MSSCESTPSGRARVVAAGGLRAATQLLGRGTGQLARTTARIEGASHRAARNVTDRLG